ncbi:MAG: SH3 domain-containing protein [Anaerolineae bacterium]|nr:SH3 domain-containing protein [Anaerolineae bacterium]
MEKVKEIFTREVLIASIVVAFILCCVMVLLQVGVFPYFNARSEQKAMVAVTPLNGDSNENQHDAAQATPTQQIQPGVVARGNVVVVIGTGQNGLRMRSEPGMDASILFLANEDEYFNVIDGPVIKDNLIWWKIQSLSDAQKAGWSAQDYLASVE